MGGCCSDVRPADNKDANNKNHNTGEGAKLAGLALKFPYVKKAFKNVKIVFEKHVVDKERNMVTMDKLGHLLQDLGAKNLSQQDLQSLFSMSDLDHSKNISFREFLIAVGVGYYLKEGNNAADSEDPHFEETRKGFLVVRETFNAIDTDRGGFVDVQELKRALFQTAGGDQSKEILDARFKELDFDGDGGIYFPEFLYGFAAWVGMDDDDDEEEEQKV